MIYIANAFRELGQGDARRAQITDGGFGATGDGR